MLVAVPLASSIKHNPGKLGIPHVSSEKKAFLRGTTSPSIEPPPTLSACLQAAGGVSATEAQRQCFDLLLKPRAAEVSCVEEDVNMACLYLLLAALATCVHVVLYAHSGRCAAGLSRSWGVPMLVSSR